MFQEFKIQVSQKYQNNTYYPILLITFEINKLLLFKFRLILFRIPLIPLMFNS